MSGLDSRTNISSRGLKTDLLKIIPGGKFDLEFSDGVHIPNSNNLYKGTLECGIPAIYHLLSNNDDARYWYKFAMENTSSYLLRMLGKSTCAVDGKIILFTEVMDKTLEDWAQQNDLIDSLNCLTLSFRVILLDILRGMIYFHKQLKRPHGKICGTNIYVIGGRAKFANVVDVTLDNKAFVDDMKNFSEMVRKLFNDQVLPSGLNYLLSNLKKEIELLNSVNNPVLLSPYERGTYRNAAYSKISVMKNYNQINNAYHKERELDHKERKLDGKSKFDWIESVKKEPYFSVLCYEPSSGQPQRHGQRQSTQGQMLASTHSQMSPPTLSQQQPLQGQMGRVQCLLAKIRPRSQRQMWLPLQTQLQPAQGQSRPLLQGQMRPPLPTQAQPAQGQPQPLSQGQMRPPLPTQLQPAQGQPLSPMAQQKIKYHNSPVEFLRFSRNVVEHIRFYDKKSISDEEKDEYLNSIAPEFLSCLHVILTSHSIFVLPLPT